MSYVIIVGIIFVALFLSAYLTRRRLGVLGLALGVGSILASLWAGDVTPLVAGAGVEIIRPPLSSLVATTLILLPPVLVFFSSTALRGTLLRFGSALIFATLAVAFLLEPLNAALVVDGMSKPIHDALMTYRPIIITLGLAFSIVDLMLGKRLGQERHSKH